MRPARLCNLHLPTSSRVAEALGSAQSGPGSCAPSRSDWKGEGKDDRTGSARRRPGHGVEPNGEAPGESLVARPDPGAVVTRELAAAV